MAHPLAIQWALSVLLGRLADSLLLGGSLLDGLLGGGLLLGALGGSLLGSSFLCVCLCYTMEQPG